MISKMFSLYDSKAAVFSTPFFMSNIGMALRAFTDISNDPGTMVCRHPEDFSLFHVAEFDDETGDIQAIPHQNLGNASAYKRSPVVQTLLPGINNSVIEEAVR